ncbi:hypothetical protein EV426DRAFT_589581 [Tirmania nivea]|nr:hypothetical protein EV426DRAFT_589581 [Tirmania nivea]
MWISASLRLVTWFYTIVVLIVTDVRCETGREVQFSRRKEIVSTDNVTGGEGEFIMMDRIMISEKKFVLIVVGRSSSTGERMNGVKDAWDNNGLQDVFFVWVRYYRRTLGDDSIRRYILFCDGAVHRFVQDYGE